MSGTNQNLSKNIGGRSRITTPAPGHSGISPAVARASEESHCCIRERAQQGGSGSLTGFIVSLCVSPLDRIRRISVGCIQRSFGSTLGRSHDCGFPSLHPCRLSHDRNSSPAGASRTLAIHADTFMDQARDFFIAVGPSSIRPLKDSTGPLNTHHFPALGHQPQDWPSDDP